MSKSKLTIFLTIICLITLIFITASVSASSFSGDKVVFGSDYELNSGDTLDGDIVIFGSDTQLKKSSTVNGSIVLFGGNLQVEGTVNGDIAAFSGSVNLMSNAVINGNFSSFGTEVERDKNAVITGDSLRQDSEGIKKLENIPLKILPNSVPATQTTRRGFFSTIFLIMTRLLVFTVELLICAAIAVITNLLFEEHLAGSSQAVIKRPLEAFGIGLLAIIILPFIQIFFCITIVLIPLAIVLAFIFVVLCLYAWITIGYELGRRLTQAIKVKWSSNWTTAAGTFVLSFVFFGLSKIMPCIGWIPAGFIVTLGIGGIIIHHGKLFQNSNNKNGKPVPPKIGNQTVTDLPKETVLPQTTSEMEANKHKEIEIQQNSPEPKNPAVPVADNSGNQDIRKESDQTDDLLISDAYGSEQKISSTEIEEKMEVPDVIELGPAVYDELPLDTEPDIPVPATKYENTPVQPAADLPGENKTIPAARKRTTKKKGIGSSILDSLHDDVTDNPGKDK
ncbi:MAG: hypothetical protein AB9907_09750 [Flexilinea sp.]